nr:hypothetical protein [Tanacetum cinerariifolium]
MIRLRDEAASTSSPPLQLPSASRREDITEVTLPPRKRLDIALGPRYEVGESSSAAAARPAGEARMSREAWVRATDASDLVYGELMSLRTTVLGQMSEIRELQAADRRRQTMILELLRIDHRRSTKILELRTALQGHVTALQAQVTTLQGQQGLARSPTQSGLPEEAGGTRISIPAPVPTPSWTDSEVVRLLALSSPPASPLSPWSSPPPQIPFPPLPSILSPPSPILSPAPPPSPIRSLGYRAAMIRLRDEAASTSSPPLQLPFASRREDRPEVTLPPRKRLNIALGPRYETSWRF